MKPEEASERQDAVRQFWNETPCGSDLSEKSHQDKAYYEEIEAERYTYQYHIPKLLDRIDWQGKRVLEIGTGVGTDARNIIGRGGIYTGINVDRGSVEATRNAIQVYGLTGSVQECSATDMVFADESFDIVYSFGVLHHIPDAASAVAEVKRVLKPGGELLIMLYNRSSINYRVEIMMLRKLALRLLGLPGALRLFGALGLPRAKLERHVEIYRQYGKLSDQEWLNRNTDGPDNPFSLVYDESEAQKLLEGFEIQFNEVYYFEARHWGVLGRLMPASVVDSLGRRWGWHRMVHARKPAA